MVAITKFGRDEIFSAVKQMYTDVANNPDRGFQLLGICRIPGDYVYLPFDWTPDRYQYADR